MGFKEAATNFVEKHRVITAFGASLIGIAVSDAVCNGIEKAYNKHKVKKALEDDIQDESIVNYYFVQLYIEMNRKMEKRFMDSWPRIIDKINVDRENSSVMLYGFYGETNSYNRPVNIYTIAFKSIDDCARGYVWLNTYIEKAIKGTGETVELSYGWNEAVFEED